MSLTMKEYTGFKFDVNVLLMPLLFVLTIWFVYWFEFVFGEDLTSYGIYPRRISGLRGVLFSPFIHASTSHLYNNTVPAFVLLGALVFFYRKVALKVFVMGVLISGLLTWFIGRSSYHIGASSLIYVLVSFIFFKGIFTRYYRLIALSLIVVFMYGGTLWYVFPIKQGMSWEGHLSGLLTGFLLAYFIKYNPGKPKKYKWEEPSSELDDPFLRHFDKEGNFIPSSEMEDEPEAYDDTISTGKNIQINYHYKKKDTPGD